MRMRQETFKKSYYIPAFGKSIEIRRNQDIDEDGILGKELLAQYGEDCILEGETKSLIEKIASGEIGGSGTSLTTEQIAAIEKIEGLEASASEIDGSVKSMALTMSIDGDSIAAQNKITTTSTEQSIASGSPFAWGNAFLKGMFKYVKNYGVGGQRTDQLLLRIDTTLQDEANYIHYIIGKNDIIQTVATSTIISNIENIIERTISAGKICVMGTIIPSTTDTVSQIESISRVNQFIIESRAVYTNYIVVDYFTSIVNYSTSQAMTDYTTDGIHPSTHGAFYMGRAFEEAFLNKPIGIYKNITPNATNNFQLATNSQFLGGTIKATGWDIYGSISNSKESLTNNNEVQVINGDGIAGISVTQSIYNGFVAGDKIVGIVEVEVSDVVNLDYLTLAIIARSSSGVVYTNTVFQLASASTIRFPDEKYSIQVEIPSFIIPLNTLRIIPTISAKINGTLKVSKFQIFNHGQA